MSTRTVRSTAARLSLEVLEAREVPAVNIAIDYTLDLRAKGGSGFFEDHADAKVALNKVAQEMGQRISANLSAITPSGANSWNAIFYNPENGQQYTITNMNLTANTLVVYVGGRVMSGGEAGQGGSGGYGYSGSAAWGNTISTRGWSGFAPWGGSIAFDTTETWHFGLTTTGLDSNESDFYSVATHEMGHLLGIGTATQWFSKVQNGTFTGTNSEAVYGAAVPVYSDSAHWSNGLKYNGQFAVMDPVLNRGERRTWTSLDQAALQDVGWAAGSVVSPPVTPPVVPPPVSPPSTATVPPVLVSGQSGQVAVYARGQAGTLASTGKMFTPFAGYTGTVRTAVADFNGDGVSDYAFTAGAGLTARTRIMDGATNQILVGSTIVLNGFTGGAYIAAGDIDKDGKAELVVSADRGGTPLVEVYTVSGNQLVKSLSFYPFGITNSNGVRVAMGDLNRDGSADLIMATGAGQAARLAIYDGAALAKKQAVTMRTSFLAFGSTVTVGANVTTGDVNGDGYDDLIVSQDAGGTSLVRVWSGADITANPTTLISNLRPLQEFYANGTTNLSGIRVTTRDLDGNGKDELVTSASGGAASWVRVLSVSSASVAALETVYPFTGQAVLAGIYVG
ncbi:MAG: FG-GAP-like repeat-containing protein [Planctomycetes bacterium]|nr:FG-GAP-like repeat-containing protein [Planctomycetota bacterium]